MVIAAAVALVGGVASISAYRALIRRGGRPLGKAVIVVLAVALVLALVGRQAGMVEDTVVMVVCAALVLVAIWPGALVRATGGPDAMAGAAATIGALSTRLAELKAAWAEGPVGMAQSERERWMSDLVRWRNGETVDVIGAHQRVVASWPDQEIAFDVEIAADIAAIDVWTQEVHPLFQRRGVDLWVVARDLGYEMGPTRRAQTLDLPSAFRSMLLLVVAGVVGHGLAAVLALASPSLVGPDGVMPWPLEAERVLRIVLADVAIVGSLLAGVRLAQRTPITGIDVLLTTLAGLLPITVASLISPHADLAGHLFGWPVSEGSRLPQVVIIGSVAGALTAAGHALVARQRRIDSGG